MDARSSAGVLRVESWLASWNRLGCSPSAVLLDTYPALLAAYAEEHRRYHTVRHLTECLSQVRELLPDAHRPAEIEIALWFHDAVYQPRKADNEQRSAEWARRCAAQAGAPAQAGERIFQLILATRHAAAPDDGDAQILVDADLAILGASPERFAEYDRDIRVEYGWVPGFLYRRNRRRVLRDFLARDPIFNTPQFRDRYEAQARDNLRAALQGLD